MQERGGRGGGRVTINEEFGSIIDTLLCTKGTTWMVKKSEKEYVYLCII